MPLGSLLGAGVSLLGGALSNRAQRRGAERALSAGTNFNTQGLFGNVNFQDGQLTTMLDPQTQALEQSATFAGQSALNQLNSLDFLGREEAEFNRLQRLRQPSIDAARASLREQQVNRGRLGFGAGGGLSGRLFNPQSAALEEAILRAQLGDVGAAREFSQGEQRFLLGQATGALNIPLGLNQALLGQARTGIAARSPQALAALQSTPDFNRARSTEGFFNALGSGLGGLFTGGGGGLPQTVPITGPGLL